MEGFKEDFGFTFGLPDAVCLVSCVGAGGWVSEVAGARDGAGLAELGV